MLRNYLTIAWRTLTRHRGYAIINVLGLALGLCACIVIYLISDYELGFDTFHPDRKRIYRVMTTITENTGSRMQFGTVPLPGVLLLQSGLSGADAVAAVQPWWGAPIYVPEKDKPGRKFDSKPEGGGYPSVALTQPSWFSLFHYDLLAGMVSPAPFTVVLAESRAHQYFGAGPVDKMLGRVIVYDSVPVRVSGIVKDWHHTDLPFTDFISFSTINTSHFKNNFNSDSWRPDGQMLLTFVKLREDGSPRTLITQMGSLVKTHADPGLNLSLGLDPLADMHFKADVIENPIRTAHMPTLYALMGIALFILLIAAINFVNLSTAQSLQRAKEVGVRKVLGGSRTSLVFQFLAETFVLCLLGVSTAVLLVNPTLRAFRSFLPPGVSFHPFDVSFLLFLLLITLITTLLAGLYPAKVLSSYLPVLTLKGSGSAKGSGKWYLRKGLIVFQFTVSLVFIIGSIVIASQINYARHKDLGFTSDAIITIDTPTPWGDTLSSVKTVAERMRRLSGVSQVALQWAGPGSPAGMSIKFTTDGKEVRVAQVDGDENLIPLYQLKIVAGRNLERADSVNEFVINETLAKAMGCKRPEDAIGRTLYWFDKPYPVVGVAADFHPGSLHNLIPPLAIINRVERERTLVVKLATAGKEPPAMKPILAQLENTWKSIYPAGTFSYQFFDEMLARAYEKDQQTGMLMNTAMGITIFICCIGLFGLAMFNAETRTREIGIRKVLGASVSSIAILLTRDIVLLITLSTCIASPIAWYFMHGWLQGFAYRIDMGWWVFVLGGLSAIFIGLATVSYQALQAALRNPVKSLRTE